MDIQLILVSRLNMDKSSIPAKNVTQTATQQYIFDRVVNSTDWYISDDPRSIQFFTLL